MVGCTQLDENGKNCSARICFIFWQTPDLIRLSIDLVINWIKTSKTFEPFCTQSEMYVLCAHIHMYKTLYHRRVRVWARKKNQPQSFIASYVLILYVQIFSLVLFSDISIWASYSEVIPNSNIELVITFLEYK